MSTDTSLLFWAHVWRKEVKRGSHLPFSRAAKSRSSSAGMFSCRPSTVVYLIWLAAAEEGVLWPLPSQGPAAVSAPLAVLALLALLIALVECFCRSLSTASPAALLGPFIRTALREAEVGLAPGGARGKGGRAGAGRPLGPLLEALGASARLDPREEVESRVDPKMISACKSLARAGLVPPAIPFRTGRGRSTSTGAAMELEGESPMDVSLPDCRSTSSSCMYATR
mmetsp:Transcript_24192/g.54517  ORF Transcript_24192/g.54517 Transcript_24192/m.54517 type:complete len:226 (-) Transcript_24192:564-1241(-)